MVIVHKLWDLYFLVVPEDIHLFYVVYIHTGTINCSKEYYQIPMRILVQYRTEVLVCGNFYIDGSNPIDTHNWIIAVRHRLDNRGNGSKPGFLNFTDINDIHYYSNPGTRQ